MRAIGIAAAIAALGVAAWQGPVPVSAQPAKAAVDAKAVVTGIRRILAENYVLPDKRPALDAILAGSLAAGRYDVAEPAALVERINEDLASVAHDKHLGLQYDPAGAAALAGGPRPDDAPPTEEQLRSARLRNHGIVELKWLSGNIRYMDLRGFIWTGRETAAAYDDAMRFLSGGDAVIIDLRHNGGGSPEAVQYLVSHFMAPGRPLVTFHMGATKVDHVSTLASLPAGRMVGKPLYVLTSGNSASAAEEFIGHVAGFRLGEVIGDNSAGAGFRNDFFPVPGGYVISVSVGRAVLASTGKDWEGVGIAPTIPIAQEKALDVATMRAMRRVARSATPEDKAALEASANLLAAKIDPVATALPLAAYAGTYGERMLRVENGSLTWQRLTNPKLVMVPIGPNRFTFEGDPGAVVDFAVEGDRVPSFTMTRPDGSKVEGRRTG
jgi:hypothetical protein